MSKSVKKYNNKNILFFKYLRYNVANSVNLLILLIRLTFNDSENYR